MRPGLAALWVGLWLAAGPAAAADLQGRLVVDLPGLTLAEAGRVVVYLDAPDGGITADAARAAATLRQRNARFAPPFLAVAVGQTVEMPNDDTIFHNVFSFSAPNDFDLGLYPAGHSRSVTFRHPGVVRIYCSIHESMTGAIFVSPTPWFTVTDEAGRFRLRGAPAGRWRLRTWSEKLPEIERTLELGPEPTAVELVVGESG